MTVKWDSEVVKLHLTPVGKPLGRGHRMSTVFREYGDYKQRIVQAIAGMLDGDVVYFDAVKDGSVRQTVPLSGWRGSCITDSLGMLLAFINSALTHDCKVVCYGASRSRWELSVETSKMTSDEIDNMSDNGRPGATSGSASFTDENGIRNAF